MARPFARIQRADARPAHCFRCPRKEDLFDMGAEALEGYGVVYMCSVCVADFLKAIGAVPNATYTADIEQEQAEVRRLTESLIHTRKIANAPIEAVRTALKEYSNGLDRSGRQLIADLDRLAVSGDLPRVAAHEDDDRPVAVPDGAAGASADVAEPADGPAEGSGDGITRDDILARLGIAASGPANADAGNDAADPGAAEDGGGSDVWGLIFGGDAGEAGQGDDDVPRD